MLELRDPPPAPSPAERQKNTQRTSKTAPPWIRCAITGLLLVIISGFLARFASTAMDDRRSSHSKADYFPRTPTDDAANFHPIWIHKPVGPYLVKTDLIGKDGTPLMMECKACHQVRKANGTTRDWAGKREFHQGLQYKHGNLTCVSCHEAGDGYSSLRLADARTLSFSEVMQLCAQCHGTQFRDYERGSHGGMQGYWDLRKGPRYRLNCIDCHDPHAPRYPMVLPTSGPNDRYLPSSREHPHE